MMAILGHEIGKALIDALGLPKQTISFVLRVQADRLVTVECEYYPDDAPALVTALAEYELVPRNIVGTEETLSFDAWMGNRINAAHDAMMERLWRKAYATGGTVPSERRLVGDSANGYWTPVKSIK